MALLPSDYTEGNENITTRALINQVLGEPHEEYSIDFRITRDERDYGFVIEQKSFDGEEQELVTMVTFVAKGSEADRRGLRYDSNPGTFVRFFGGESNSDVTRNRDGEDRDTPTEYLSISQEARNVVNKIFGDGIDK